MIPIVLYIFIPLLKMLDKSGIDKSLNFLGKISLESYLTNITLKSILGVLIPAYISMSQYLEYAIIVVVGLLLAYYVHNVAKKILSKIFATTV